MKRLVLIGDIVSSREIVNRGLIQENLVRILEHLNSDENLISPYTLTLGDEFQAVFKNPDSIFTGALEILVSLFPIKIRYSFGLGEIATQINYKQAIGMDGPAFYNARLGIENIKKDPSYLFHITGLNHSNLTLINKTLHLISHNLQGWNRNRLEALLLRLRENSIQEISEKLHISDKAIYKTINVGAIEVIKQLLNEILQIINKDIKEV
jgi:hypothetical protein